MRGRWYYSKAVAVDLYGGGGGIVLTVETATGH